MVSSYDRMMGSELDVDTHPSRNMPQATEHYAGDVVELPATGRGGGHQIDAPAYATGAAKDPKVLSIGMPTLKAWSIRKSK